MCAGVGFGPFFLLFIMVRRSASHRFELCQACGRNDARTVVSQGYMAAARYQSLCCRHMLKSRRSQDHSSQCTHHTPNHPPTRGKLQRPANGATISERQRALLSATSQASWLPSVHAGRSLHWQRPGSRQNRGSCRRQESRARCVRVRQRPRLVVSSYLPRRLCRLATQTSLPAWQPFFLDGPCWTTLAPWVGKGGSTAGINRVGAVPGGRLEGELPAGWAGP